MLIERTWGRAREFGVQKIAQRFDGVDSITARNKYGVYSLPANCIHRPACWAVVRGRVYEPDTIEFIISHLDGRSLVTGGTFFGDFLPAVSPAADVVYAFEPNASSFAHARRTIELNGLSNVRLTHAAIGNMNRTTRLVTTDANGAPLGGRSHVADGGDEEVDEVTLDSMLPADRSQIGIIHLDVEGLEQAALEGALALIGVDRPTLIVETLPDSAWMSAQLDGYTIVDRLNRNYVLMPQATSGAAMTNQGARSR